MTPDELKRQLRSAAGDLTYPSDADEPFDPFVWPAAAGDAVAQVRARSGNRPVEVVAVAAFFADLTDADDAARFTALRAALERTVSDLIVIRVTGSTTVDVYLIGRGPAGSWAGLHTLSVET